MAVRVTDDEVVALAAREGVVWAIPLPTVQIDDRRDFGTAIARGVRSLRIRGLVTEAAGGTAPIDELRDVVVGLGSRPGLLVQSVLGGNEGQALGGAVLASAVDQQRVLIDLIAADGVHELEVVPKANAIATVVGYLSSVFSQAESEERGTELVTRVVLGDDTGVVRVGRGSAQLGSAQPLADWGQAEAQLVARFDEVLVP